MNLKGIISIAGKPGLFKVVSQGKNSLIVESLIDKKRFPAFSSDKVSALEDISMYTTDEDVLLGEIIQKIYDKENGGPCVDSKAEANEHHTYFAAILPNYDKERVYNSDLKKLFSWYNLLLSSGMIAEILEADKAAEKEAKAEKKSSKKAEAAKEEVAEEKEDKPKKKAADKKTTKKPVAKTVAPKVKAENKAKTTARKTATTKRGA